MQLERDALQRISLPGINTEAKQYGERVSMCDLRWGVNTSDMSEEDGSRKVLDYCLDAIDRCEPVMIILLGERYGWIPDEEMIHSVSDRKRMQLDDYEISVTALEIEYGAFFRKAKTLVYFREAEDGFSADGVEEDELHRKKLAALKEKIRRIAGGNVKTYKVGCKNGAVTGIDEFAETVRADVTRLFSEDWKRYENETENGRERLIHRGLFSEDAEAFCVGHGVLKEIKSKIKRKGKIVNIDSESGGGKSTMMGKLMLELEDEGYDVLPVRVGATAQSSTYNGVLLYINAYFREVLGYTSEYDDSADDDTEAFYNMELKDVSLSSIYRTFWNKRDMTGQMEALMDYAEQYDACGRRLAILVDGMNLFHIDRGEDSAVFIPNNITKLKNVTVVLSSNDPMKRIGVTNVTLDGFSYDENKKMIERKLSQTHRELDRKVMAALLKKCEGKTPIYMNFLLKKLFMMDVRDFSVMRDMESVSARQRLLIETASNDVSTIGREVLAEAAGRISYELLNYAMNCISISREGLTEGELSALWGEERFNKADFYAFIAYMGDSFVLRQNGRYDFANVMIKEGVRLQISDKRAYAEAIVSALTEEFIKEQLSSSRPEYSIIQEIAHITLKYCSIDTLMRVVLRFREISESFFGDREHTDGAKFCLQVLCLSLDDSPEELLRMMTPLAERLRNAEGEELYSAIDFFDCFALDASEVLSAPEICETYLELLERAPSSPEINMRAASVAENAYMTARFDEDDAERAEKYFIKTLELYISGIGDVTVGGENDIIYAISHLINEYSSRDKFSDAVNKRVDEILLQCAEAAQTVATLPEGLISDEERAVWSAKYLFCLYARLKYTFEIRDHEEILTEAQLIAAVLAVSSDEIKESFFEFSSTNEADIYGTVADAAKRAARITHSSEHIESGVLFLKEEREVRLALADENGEGYNECKYLESLISLYELSDEGYEKEITECLTELLSLTGGGLYAHGRRFNAADKLYKRLGERKYAERAIEIMHEMYALYCEDCEKYRYEDVLDDFLFLMSDSPETAEDTLDDSIYMAEGLIDDISRSLEICRRLVTLGADGDKLGADALSEFFLEQLEYLKENYPDKASEY